MSQVARLITLYVVSTQSVFLCPETDWALRDYPWSVNGLRGWHCLVEQQSVINPFRTAVPFWGQTTRNLSGLSQLRDCGSKGVKHSPVVARSKWCACSSASRSCVRVCLSPETSKKYTSNYGYTYFSWGSILSIFTGAIYKWNIFGSISHLPGITTDENEKPSKRLRVIIIISLAIRQCAAWSSAWITHNLPEKKKSYRRFLSHNFNIYFALMINIEVFHNNIFEIYIMRNLTNSISCFWRISRIIVTERLRILMYLSDYLQTLEIVKINSLRQEWD